MQSLGVTSVYDLRSVGEGQRAQAAHNQAGITTRFNSIALGPDIKVHPTPIFAHEDWSPEAVGERYLRYAQEHALSGSGYAEVYRDMLERGHEAIRVVLLHVRDHPTEPFLCHCSAGKDRTGVVVAVLLKLAGCDDEVVAREYALTELGLAARKEFIVQYLLRKPEVKGSRVLAERVASASYSNMWETLQMVRSKYGSMAGYVMKFCSLTESDLDSIQQNLTCSDAPSQWAVSI
jgi:hypothetical protein